MNKLIYFERLILKILKYVKIKEDESECFRIDRCEFKMMFDRIGLKINIGKSKVLVVKKDKWWSCEKMKMSCE